MSAPDRQLVLTACALLALQAEQQRRGTAGPRAARACVARLVLAGYLDAARALAVELGMSPLHPRVRVVALSGFTGATAAEVLDAIDAALPRPLQQLVAAADADEIWVILLPADSASALAVIERIRARRAPGARLLVSDELDVGEISVHRPGIRRSLQQMAPGEDRDLARPEIPGSARAVPAALVALPAWWERKRRRLRRLAISGTGKAAIPWLNEFLSHLKEFVQPKHDCYSSRASAALESGPAQ